jgi:hypothetical protein
MACDYWPRDVRDRLEVDSMTDLEVEMCKPPKLPQPVVFHQVHGVKKLIPHPCFYDVIGFRAPKEGEWFLSGAIVEAYKASRDFPETSKYWIVRPTNFAVKRWWKGERVEVTA